MQSQDEVLRIISEAFSEEVKTASMLGFGVDADADGEWPIWHDARLG